VLFVCNETRRQIFNEPGKVIKWPGKPFPTGNWKTQYVMAWMSRDCMKCYGSTQRPLDYSGRCVVFNNFHHESAFVCNWPRVKPLATNYSGWIIPILLKTFLNLLLWYKKGIIRRLFIRRWSQLSKILVHLMLLSLSLNCFFSENAQILAKTFSWSI